ncbi:MAG: HEAT repeat domain-containing protein [Clostridiales bacterium]|nr:HEAT repeat domain-containing protein [Clostridiales bacterium]
MKKRLIAAVLMLSMIGSLAACGKKDETTEATKSPDATKPKTEATEETTTAEPTTEESTEPVEEGLTKEKYDTMTAEELLEMAEIADLEKVTDDEYFWLLETYRFVDIDYDQMILANTDSITKQAIKMTKGGSLNNLVERLLASEYPQVRGIGYTAIASLFGASDKDIQSVLTNLETETDDYCLFCATDGLMNSMKNDPKVAEFIFKMSEYPSPRIRCRAAMAIGNSWSIGVDGTVERIIEMMKDEDQDVRAAAVLYAGKLHDDAVVAPIVEVLNNEADAKIHGDAIRGLSYMWLDYPTHEHTSEAAYRATLDYYSKTPRNGDVPVWNGISGFNVVSEKQLAESNWYANATYFNADEFTGVMSDLIADPDMNWLAKGPAMKAVIALCPEKFDSLQAAVDSLGEQKVTDQYDKLKEELAAKAEASA